MINLNLPTGAATIKGDRPCQRRLAPKSNACIRFLLAFGLGCLVPSLVDIFYSRNVPNEPNYLAGGVVESWGLPPSRAACKNEPCLLSHRVFSWSVSVVTYSTCLSCRRASPLASPLWRAYYCSSQLGSQMKGGRNAQCGTKRNCLPFFFFFLEWRRGKHGTVSKKGTSPRNLTIESREMGIG